MFEYILLALLFAASIFLIVVVTIQKSSDEGLSGTIAGGADTFFSKNQSKTTIARKFIQHLEAAVEKQRI